MEILMLLLAVLLGCGAGVLTGLLPGLHTNTVAIIVLALIPLLSKFFPLLSIAVFFVAMIVVHSFIDFIPSIFLGAPEAETALSVLPGHRMLLQGHGYKALKLTVIGGIGTFFIGLALIPIIFFFLKGAYPYLSVLIAPILLSFSAIFILTEKGFKRKLWALLIFLLSGVLGILVLNNLDVKEPLFPLLSGLFGISTLIISMFGHMRVAKQKLDDKVSFFGWNKFFDYIKAAASATIVSILPAIGAAQATIIAQGFVRFKNHEDYLVIIGGINTVSTIFVLTTLFLINKARTGVVAAMQQFMTLDWRAYAILMAVAFIAAGLSIVLTIKIGRVFAANISKINYRKLSLFIIGFILVLAAILSGFLGFLVALIATGVGLLAPKVGCRRIHAMGVLVLPVVFYFI